MQLATDELIVWSCWPPVIGEHVRRTSSFVLFGAKGGASCFTAAVVQDHSHVTGFNALAYFAYYCIPRDATNDILQRLHASAARR